MRGSLLGYWRLLSLLASNARQRVDQLVLHLPAQQVAALKALAAGGLGGCWGLADVAWPLQAHSLVPGAPCSSQRPLLTHRTAPPPLKTEGNSVAGITTGDAVQAAAALLMHAAQAKPLLPVAPKVMAVLVQMPAPPGYFGNAARMLKVSLPAGSAQPAAGDYADALRTLAGAIHEATASFRSDPVRCSES